MTNAVEMFMSKLKTVPDFPEPGILFRDLTPVFADAKTFRATVDAMLEPFAGQYDAIAGLEARGFILAAAGAMDAGVGVLPVRKAGKLPGEVISQSYSLEYGVATFEVSPDALPAGSRVLILDDVLATGGTLGAAIKLIEHAGWQVAGISVALEIQALEGRAKLPADIHTFSLVQL